MKTWTVTLRFKYPAWDEREGIPYDVRAESKSEAIKRARRQAWDDGHLVGIPVTQYSLSASETNQSRTR